MEIRKLGKNDVKLMLDLVEVWRKNFTKQQISLDDWQITERLSDKNFHAIVAIQSDKVLGGLTAYSLPLITRDETKMLLYEIEVQEKFRKIGIASMLIEELINLCKELQIKTIFLCSDIENEAAQELYKKMGGEKEIVLMYNFKLGRINQEPEI